MLKRVPTNEMESPETTSALLPPNQVFQAWKRLHDVEAVRKHPNGRKFLVANYACPHRAGNLLHDYMSVLLQAIASNRTLLWKYKPEIGKQFLTGSEEACARILDRADWIPSFKDVSKELKLTEQEPYFHMEVSEVPPTTAIDISEQQVIFPSPLRGLEQDRFELWRGLLFLEENRTNNFLSVTYGIDLTRDDRVSKLYSQGVSYLYGMLFWESFSFTEGFLASLQDDFDRSKLLLNNRRDDEPYSIAIHSRHVDADDNGSDVQDEIRCIDWLLSLRPNNKERCTVYIMADRQATIQNITEYLAKNTNCAAISASAREQNDDSLLLRREHGQYAGATFFRDLAIASQARSAVAASARSSSALLDEWIDYRRRNEAWHRNQRLLEPLKRCYFKWTPHGMKCDDKTMNTACLKKQRERSKHKVYPS